MNNHLVRLTEDDFAMYRTWYSKIIYSSRKPSTESDEIYFKELATITLMQRSDYLDAVNNRMIEMYLMVDSSNEVNGVTTLSFREDMVCMINDFCVFKEGFGLGTELYNLVCEKIQARGYSSLEAWYPFDTALGFLKKIGLSRKKQGQNVFVGRIMALVQPKN